MAGLALDELLVQVRSLPPDTVPIVFSFQRDGTGRTFAAGEVLRLVDAESNRPVFGVLGDILSMGLVGGPLPDYRKAGRRTAAHVLDRIKGRPPGVETIPAIDYVSNARAGA